MDTFHEESPQVGQRLLGSVSAAGSTTLTDILSEGRSSDSQALDDLAARRTRQRRRPTAFGGFTLTSSVVEDALDAAPLLQKSLSAASMGNALMP
jgi:hypothetical protein